MHVTQLVEAITNAGIPVMGVEFGDDSTDHEITITDNIAVQLCSYAGGCCVNVYDGVDDDFGCTSSPICGTAAALVERVKEALRIVGACPADTDRADWYGSHCARRA